VIPNSTSSSITRRRRPCAQDRYQQYDDALGMRAISCSTHERSEPDTTGPTFSLTNDILER
jgi:hypothetical protein